MSYTKFSRRSWVFTCSDWTQYQKIRAITGISQGEINEEKFRALMSSLIDYAYENDLGGLRNAFYHAYTDEKRTD